MHAILRINSYDFLFTKPADATKALELLCKALRVDQRWCERRKSIIYQPVTKQFQQLSLTMVSPKDIDFKSLATTPDPKPVKRTGRLLLAAPLDQDPLFQPDPYAPKGH